MTDDVSAEDHVRNAGTEAVGQTADAVLDADVVVVGAGPVGLWLAAELHAAGIRVLVLEARATRAEWSRGFIVHARTLEIFDTRGVAAPVVDAGRRLPRWHYAIGGPRLDLAALPTNFPFVLTYPQAGTEEVLERRYSELGGAILRGHRVTGLTQFADRVEAAVETPSGPRTVTARYLVGCDGARSTVRGAAGIASVGGESTVVSPGAVVVFDDPPPPERYMQAGDNGVVFMIPLDDGRFLISVIDHATMRDTAAEFSVEWLRDAMRRVAGTDYGMRDPQRRNVIGNAAAQAERYRLGRVLLSGDSAHSHFPMGGQGMNLGIQDAHNLAWRLAAVIGADAPDSLLDGYEAERRPVGEDVVDDVRAQMAIVTATGPDGVALRRRFRALLDEHVSLNRDFARRLSWLAVRYGGHRRGEDQQEDRRHTDARTGARVPDLPLDVDGAATSTSALSKPGRFLFLDLTGGDVAAKAATCLAGTGFAGLVDIVSGRCGEVPRWAVNEGWHLADAILVRPDGYAAWTGSSPEEAAEAFAALLAAPAAK
jgi:2-polyprenyl-6-methoxyphenol hydroxylase-like FAD-dependent oxidoreductase